MLGGNPASPHECSRAGCNDEASWAILWRNPKIHAGDRRKTWLACNAHRSFLQDFLAARSFPLEVLTLAAFLERTVPEEPSS